MFRFLCDGRPVSEQLELPCSVGAAPREFPNELGARSVGPAGGRGMAEDAALSLNAPVLRNGAAGRGEPDTLRGWAKQPRADAGPPRITTGDVAKTMGRLHSC